MDRNQRAVTHDSLAPDRLTLVHTAPDLGIALQLSVNEALMRRMDALTARMTELERKVKEQSHMASA